MITSAALVPASQITSEFTSRGLTIYPKDNEIFGTLISTMGLIDENADDIMKEIAKASMPNGNIDNIDVHEWKADHAADIIATKLNNIANYCRNTVNPIIKEIHERAEKVRQERETLGLNAGIQIKPLFIEPILKTETMGVLLDTITPITNTTALPLTLHSKLWNSIDAAEVAETMMSGSDSFNTELISFLAKNYPAGSLKSVDTNGNGAIARTTLERFTKNDDLVCFLFYRGVYTGKHPKVQFSDLDKADQDMVKAKVAFWGGRLQARIDQVVRLQKSGSVVAFADQDDSVLYVHRQAYTTWLNDGNSASALMGYWLSTGKKMSGVDANHAAANKERYEDVFKRHARTEATRVQATVNDELQRVIIRAIISEIKENVNDNDQREALILKANKFYSTMDINSFDSPLEYIKLLVCKTIAKGTDAYEIISDITEYGKEFSGDGHNEQDVMEEAVVNALSNAYARWFAMYAVDVVDDSLDMKMSRR